MEVGAVVVWAVAIAALSVLGAPIAVAVCRPRPRLGATLGLPVALAWVTLGAFWLGQLRFGPTTVVVVAGSLLVATAILWRSGPPVPPAPLAAAVAVALAAFLAMVLLRSFDPAAVPYASEKFLDYSLLRAILAAEALPPPDPWFAGEPVRYYYGGQLLVATLATVTGTTAALAYNLGFATVFAATVVGAFGVGGAVAEGIDAPRGHGGILAAFLVAIAGNLTTAARLVGWPLPDAATARWASLLHLGEGGLLDGPTHFFYWDASRVVPAPVEFFTYMINEFPFFAFVHGDLHAHVVAMPFVVSLVGLLAAWYGADPDDPRALVVAFAAVAAMVALLVVVNAWSVITAIGLIGVTVAASAMEVLDPDATDRPSRHVGRAVLLGVLAAGAVAAVAAVLAAPFLVTLRAETAVGVFPHRTPLASAVMIYGGFLAVVGVGLAVVGGVSRRAGAIAALGVLAVAVLATALGLGTAALLGGVVAATTWLAVGRGVRPFAVVLTLAAAGLVLSMEFLYVDDPSSWERLNTLFKLGIDAWLLFGIAAGAFLADLVHRRVTVDVGHRQVRASGLHLALAVIVLVGLFAGFAVAQEVVTARDDPTLDATVYLEEEHPGEAEAIRWLDRRPGDVVLAEYPGERMYRWVSAPSTYSHATSVAGWSHAANYQAAHGAFGERVADLETLFEGSPEDRRAVLERYEVTHVYVGPNERRAYRTTLADDPTLTVAFENEAVTIYRVEPTDD